MENGLYSRPVLGEVTLVAVTSVAVKQTLWALQQSMRQMAFGKVLLLTSDNDVSNLPSEIELRTIPRISSKQQYSEFMLTKLHEHISTRHMLCVQWDGYVTNGRAWSPEFLEYDFIGAPWPHFRDEFQVGNGGFSLRSTRLMKVCASLSSGLVNIAEDVAICRDLRPALENTWGMRFAPVDVARCFSFERSIPSGMELGFHGSFNMAKVVRAKEAARIFGALEPNVMTRGEEAEIFRWAIARGELILAWAIAARIISKIWKGTKLLRATDG